MSSETTTTNLNKHLKTISRYIKEEAGERVTAVFLPLTSISKDMCKELNDVGLKACHVDSYMDYKPVLQDFEDGKYQVICNSMLITEGYDHPPISCVVNLRNTDSRALYSQIIGRGTRPYPGKEDLLILDFLYQSENFDICRPSVLFAKDREVAQRMMNVLSDEMMDLLGLHEHITEEIAREKQSSLLRELEKNKNKRKRNVDPLAFACYIRDYDLTNYEPTMKWEEEKAKEDTLKLLFKMGIDTSVVRCEGQAVKLLKLLDKRSEMNLASPKQINLLRKYKYKGVGSMTKEQATKLINLTRKNGWKPLKEYQR